MRHLAVFAYSEGLEFTLISPHFLWGEWIYLAGICAAPEAGAAGAASAALAAGAIAAADSKTLPELLGRWLPK